MPAFQALTWLYERGATFNWSTVTVAVLAGELPILQYLDEQGAVISQQCLDEHLALAGTYSDAGALWHWTMAFSLGR